MSLSKLKSEFDVFKQRANLLSKELRVNFPPLFSALFEKHAWVEGFSWRQCEPWRDGQETEFEVLSDPEQIYINDMDWYSDEVYYDEAKKSAFKEFSDVLSSIPADIMKALFGESNEVEVKRNGDMSVTEYQD